ncbi:NUDIX domain-containing protein [Spongiactinospora sp. TRM90649]|uniref:NUDIX hydrolase n=1 Tax=Spongiactinospora sp. TRM90649 TaxID=3031114 RepID=UPI0023F9A55B|nr:NUDIX domain-containing protein [Spongiactinospora sp. TRM90649]MDF5753011.1 NUDIX domain-containing protein [Spongiactinospora sp. TRM90649]
MAAKDGDGWALCGRGHRHWGVHGAAGLLAVHHDMAGTAHVLMQKRSWWSHFGGTWGVPGGARDSHEDSASTAMREAREEAGLDGDGLRVQAVYRDDHGGWTFDTVIAEAVGLLPAAPTSGESAELRWVPAGDVQERRLHPGFAEAWPALRPALAPVVLVLDMANIVGARAEHGWWRDRAGAAEKLLAEVKGMMDAGVGALPEEFPDLTLSFPRVIAVVEGAARAAGSPGGITVVRAPGSGDDAIVQTVHDIVAWERVLVVTADRELRRRVSELGASVAGPGWLLSRL